MFFINGERRIPKSERLLARNERNIICVFKKQISNVTHHEEAERVTEF